MTRKHFRLIADAMRASRPQTREGEPLAVTVSRRMQWTMDCAALGMALSATNPRFDHDRFADACGMTPISDIPVTLSREGA